MMFDMSALIAWLASADFWKDIFVSLIGALFVGGFVLLRDRRKHLEANRYASAQLTNAARHLNEALYVYSLWMTGISLTQLSAINGTIQFDEKLLQLLTRTEKSPGRDMIVRADALAAEALGHFDRVGWQLDPRARSAVADIQEDLRLFRSVLRRILLSYDRRQRVLFSEEHLPNFARSVPALRKAALAYVIADADKAAFASGKVLTVGELTADFVAGQSLTQKAQAALLGEWGRTVPGAPNDRIIPQDWQTDFNGMSMDLIFGTILGSVSTKSAEKVRVRLDGLMSELAQDPVLGRAREVETLLRRYQMAREGSWDVQVTWARAAQHREVAVEDARQKR